MVSIRELLSRLNAQKVEYVIVGGMAAVLHGSAVITEDLDLCAAMTADNLQRIVAALADMNPCHRMNPNHPKLSTDPGALKGIKNLYLTTDAGQLDILEAIDGVGDYASVAKHAETLNVFGEPCRVLDLNTLILAKTAVGRPKDLRVVADLEVVRKKLKEK